jgi:hypothetical protein
MMLKQLAFFGHLIELITLLKIDKNTICLYGMDINTTLRSKGE